MQLILVEEKSASSEKVNCRVERAHHMQTNDDDRKAVRLPIMLLRAAQCDSCGSCRIELSEGLKSIKNLRDKHVAHYLTQSNAGTGVATLFRR